MLKGDLASTPLPEVLRQLADGAATGCLNVLDGAGETAKVYLRGGRVYAVNAPGKRPQLGARLVSSGALGPEALAEALEAQRTELQGWRLGELLVHLGYVDQPVVEDFVNEQVRASLSDLLPWRHATWKFRVNERTREDVAPPVEVSVLLEEIDARLDQLCEMEELAGGPDAVPLLSAGDTAGSETEIDADAWSLLCKVDGVRTVTELARECGFTLYEAGRVVYALVQAGLLEVEEPEEVVDAAAFLAEAASASELAPADVASRLATALSGPPVPGRRDVPTRALEAPHEQAEVDGSISRVSEALAALLGPATASDDVFGAPAHRPSSAPPPPPVDPKKFERDRLAALRRAADAEELAIAQAELEAARAASEASFTAEHGEDHVAVVVDLQSVRAAAEAQAAVEAARLEQERLEEERLEEERLAAEAAEQARAMSEAAEQARLEEERLAAEAAEQARLEQERLAAEAAEQTRLEEEARLAEEHRLAAEAAEQARLDEEARLEREADEQARLEEQARLAEEARVAEEHRLAAEAAEQARLEEEDRLAAEAAEQAHLDEQARLAAEAEEQRRAQEEADAAERARLEEESRIAAEEHRLAAEAAEQARLEEQAQQAAEALEQARREEQARLDEQARVADEARLAAEAAEQARIEEQERQAAQAAEQARLAELARLEEQAVLEEQARLEEELRTVEQQRLAAEAAAEQAHLDEEAHTAQEQARQAGISEFAALTADFDDAPTADHETQAAAFAELSASAAVAVAEPVHTAGPVIEVDDEPMPSYHQDTDTAALMRELSSLGLDDDPPPPPPARPARPPAARPVAAPPKKKKGLFGRG